MSCYYRFGIAVVSCYFILRDCILFVALRATHACLVLRASITRATSVLPPGCDTISRKSYFSCQPSRASLSSPTLEQQHIVDVLQEMPGQVYLTVH